MEFTVIFGRAAGTRVSLQTDTHEEELRGYVEALQILVDKVAGARSGDDVFRVALETIRDSFHLLYGSVWVIDPKEKVLKLRMESGSLSDRFAPVTRGAAFSSGSGLAGRAWSQRELIFEPDLRVVSDCPRAQIAYESGVRSAVAFPLFREGQIVATMDFMADEEHTPGLVRLQVLRCVAKLVSQALERVLDSERRVEMQSDMAAINAVVKKTNESSSERETIRATLDTVRAQFGWEYGSYWEVDSADNTLKNKYESGSAGEEFREVTRKASFARGVGVAGRTWSTRDLVFEPDLGLVTDCVRAPAAQRAGVKSGVSLPIIVEGEVIGTMDFFTTKDVDLTEDRASALRNTAFLVSSALERIRDADRTKDAGEELLSSITEVERNVVAASNVAAEAQRLTDEASRIVANLNQSSNEIGNVMNTITSIAEQTNLLALNATIEAARAGEAGKGFAVVANEVKELSRETSTATEEVGAKVSAIQADAQSVVQALVQVKSTVEQINDAQNVISGVLTEQSAVTRSVLGQG
ncbi:GAF domain-containing protein [Dermatophilus congolensis]|uniref:GAF domain-containing protein n=1 Tax=Dermatophilus congolensis TaxID=1863 RepID=UPI000A005405|nr:GAF domain-containing protein [Dermatophilus congolensis]